MEVYIANCPQGMERATLGAWRDHELPPTQMQRVEAHVRGCRACQQALTEMDVVGGALRRFDPPQMQDAIWRDVQMNIQAKGKSRMTGNQSKTALLGGLAALGVVTILAAIIVVFTATTPIAGSTYTATRTTGPTATATPSLGLVVAPGQDWTTLQALSHSENVAFAASAPLTGYACVVPTITFVTGYSQRPLLIAVTHDGGSHWQVLPSKGIYGGDCILSVNPMNPNEIVVQTNDCLYSGFCAFSQVFRSRDGGQSWVGLALPPNADAGSPFINLPIFAGDALFFGALNGASSPTPTPQHTLAVSVNGGAPTWIDLSQFAPVQTGDWYGFGSAFYLIFDAGAPKTGYVEKTTDDGATWTKIAAQELPNSGVPNLLACDGKTLYLSSGVDTIFATTNGAKWQALPQPSVNANGSSSLSLEGQYIGAAPDGTLYRQDSTLQIYRAKPGDSAWQPLPGNHQLATNLNSFALACNAQGKAVALWATYAMYANDGSAKILTLQYRAP